MISPEVHGGRPAFPPRSETTPRSSTSAGRAAALAIGLALGGTLAACEGERDSPRGKSPTEGKTDRDEAAATALLERGEVLFQSYCSACHAPGGQGIEGGVPPLDSSPWVSGSERRLVRIVLHGLHGPIEIQGKTYDLSMPSFGPILGDEEIAAILTYARERFGKGSPPVEPETVRRIREATAGRDGYWTVEELLEVE